MAGPAVTAAPAALPGGVPHLLRAVERFFTRQGSQFGAAITYFSVLAVVPILMFAFAAAGLVLTVARPDLLLPLADTIADAVGTADPESREQIYGLVARVLANWRSIGVFGLVWALYSGAGWMGNLKNAVRAQWRPRFEPTEPPPANLVLAVLKEWVVNLGQLVLLLVAMAVTFGLAAVSTSLTDRVLDLLGADDVGWLAPLLRVVPVAFSIGAAYLLFVFLYTVLPEERGPRRVVHRGALVAAVGLVALQLLSTFLIGRFSASPSFAVFGSVIALMLFLNLFAQLILFMAAWIGTAEHPATAPHAPAGGGSEEEAATAPRSALQASVVAGLAHADPSTPDRDPVGADGSGPAGSTVSSAGDGDAPAPPVAGEPGRPSRPGVRGRAVPVIAVLAAGLVGWALGRRGR